MGTGADGNWHRVHLWGKTLSHFIGTSLAASFSQMCFLTHFPPSLKSPHKWCISYRSDTCMMHFVWSLLLGKIIKILPILKGVCKLLTSTVCIYIYCIYIYIYSIYIYMYIYIYIYIYTVCVLEVCTGSKLKPEPGPYPRSSDPTRPDPSGTVKFRARTRPEIPPPHNE